MRDLLYRLLDKDPTTRITIEECMVSIKSFNCCCCDCLFPSQWYDSIQIWVDVEGGKGWANFLWAKTTRGSKFLRIDVNKPVERMPLHESLLVQDTVWKFHMRWVEEYISHLEREELYSISDLFPADSTRVAEVAVTSVLFMSATRCPKTRVPGVRRGVASLLVIITFLCALCVRNHIFVPRFTKRWPSVSANFQWLAICTSYSHGERLMKVMRR